MNTNIRMAVGAIVGASILGMVMTNTVTLRGQLLGNPSINGANPAPGTLPWLNVSSTPSVGGTTTTSFPNLGSTPSIPTPPSNSFGNELNNEGNAPDITGSFSTAVPTINPTTTTSELPTIPPQPMPTPMCEVSDQQVSEVTNLIAIVGQTRALLGQQEAQLQAAYDSLMATNSVGSSTAAAAVPANPVCAFFGLGC